MRFLRGGSRQQAHAVLLALPIGIVLVGLLLPFAFGEKVGEKGPFNAGSAVTQVEDEPTLAEAAAGVGGASGSALPSTRLPSTTLPPADVPAAASLPGESGTGTEAPKTNKGTVTDVKIGVLLLDLAGIGELGFQGGPGSPEQQRKFFDAYLAEANERHAAAGVRIAPVYVRFNPLEEGSMQAACLRLAQDEKVFAALNVGGYYGDAILCLTERFKIGLVAGSSEAIPWYQRSQGRFFSLTPNKDRLLANQAGELDRLGALGGKTIGILTKEPQHQDGAAVVRTLEPVLRSLGHKVAYRSELSNDPGTAATQIPVTVSQMRRAGVDFVFMATNVVYATQFVQQADSQGFHPQYSASDFAQGTVDFSTQNMPESFDGAIGVTSTRINEHRIRRPEPARDRACRELLARRGGIRLERGTDDYGTAMLTCDLTEYIGIGLARSSGNLDRANWSQAMQSIGPVTLANSGAGAFRPGKFDAGDEVRIVRWRSNCKCWIPEGEFIRGRY